MAYNSSIRLYVTDDLLAGELVALNKAQSHYLLNVMRQSKDDEVLLFNGHDGEWQAIIHDVMKKQVMLEVTNQHKIQKVEADIWLLTVPIKNARMQIVIEKATELGVSKIIPVTSDRSVVRKINKERMLAHAIEAAEQSERLTVPLIDAITPIKNLLLHWPQDRKIIWCDETGTGASLHHAITHIESKKWAVIIGPEGGFSDQEIEFFTANDYMIPVSLGPRILRADTATIAALTGLQMIKGDW